MEFSVLGPLEVSDGSGFIELRAAKQRMLLAMLLAHPDAPVSIARLVDAVWGANPPRTALENLRLYVYHLRRALGDRQRIVCRPPGYGLLLRPGELDATRFESLGRQGRQALAEGDAARAARLLREGLELWRGPPYADLDHVAPLRDEASRLEGRRQAALEARIEADLALGRHGDLVDELSRLVSRHPLRERLRGQLMLTLYRSGRQAEALQVYRDTRHLLADELGLDPGPELRRVERAILTADPCLDLSTTGPADQVPRQLPAHTPSVGGTDQRRAPTVAPSPPTRSEAEIWTATDASASAPLPVPRQLPTVTRHFTGRVPDLARLDALLPAADNPHHGSADRVTRQRRASAAMISAIDGTAGVGKTTLAVTWAHRVRDVFPDGQLYVNLRGYDPGTPATPGEVLDGFLRALNVAAGKVPPTVEERAALFRSLVDSRRVLVVLDNAHSAEQVRPLLPGSSSCLVVVTSRASLTGLAVSVGAVRINLDLLPLRDAVALLRTIIGAQRADAEPEMVSTLAELCVRLPLALQLVGQRAAARPHLRLVDVVAELADEAQRLDVLSTGADQLTAVRPVFSWSYRSLPDGQARMFRLLGLHPGPDISTHAAAALAGTTPAEALGLLDGLAEAHLTEHADRDRFRLHDLLRAYAREHAEAAHPPEDRHQALHRLIGHYLHTTAAADHLLHPGRARPRVDGAPPPGHPVVFTGYDCALEWCETERANLVAVTRIAAETALYAAAWQLPGSLWSFFYIRKHWTDWTTVCWIGLDAARRLGDPDGQARMLGGLATVHRDQRRFNQAIDLFRQTLELRHEIGDRSGEATSLSNLGDAYLGLRRYDEAIDHSRQALKIVREIGDQYSEGIALGNVAEAYLGLHRYDDALDSFRRVLELCREIGHRYGEGLTLLHLGEAYLGLHRYDDAVDHLTQAVDLCRGIGDSHGEGRALNNLGRVYHAAGRPDTARQCWQAAMAIFGDLGDPEVDEIRAQLSDVR